MKKVLLISLTVLAIGLFLTQTGFAYQNFNQGCLTCHPTAAGTGLHTVAAHSSCGTCHTGGVPGQNVESSACIVCHPRTGDNGLCPLIDAPVHASVKATCLGCHPPCAPATTTTVPAATTTSVRPTTTSSVLPTTTTSVQPTTTTIQPATTTTSLLPTTTQDNDTDNDGVPDDAEDNCPESNLDETIIIGKCDSGVINQRFEDGCTMSDLIAGCSIEARNHIKNIRCVAHLTNEWKAEGLISGEQKGAIQRCAAKHKKSKEDDEKDDKENGKGDDEDDGEDND